MFEFQEESPNIPSVQDESIGLLNNPPEPTKNQDPVKRYQSVKAFLSIVLLTVIYLALVYFSKGAVPAFIVGSFWAPYGVIGGRLLANFIGEHIKGHRISEADRINLQEASYPRYYNVLSFFVIAVPLGLSIYLLFPLIHWFPLWQESLFGKNSLYFTNTGTSYLVAGLSALGSIFIFAYVSLAVTWVFSSSQFKNYLRSQNMNGYDFDLWSTSTAFLIVAVSFFLIISPLFYLSFHDYKAIFPDKIVANSLFDFKDHQYNFSDLLKVNVTSEVSGANPPAVFANVDFIFKDGSKIGFVDYENWPAAEKIRSLYSIIKEKNVPLVIEPPSQATLTVERNEHYCISKQESFNAIFQINEPLNPTTCF